MKTQWNRIYIDIGRMMTMGTKSKSLILCVIFSMTIFLQTAFVSAALPEIVVISAVSSVSAVTEGTEFTLRIEFENKSDEELGDILLDFSLSDDVIVKAGGSTVQYTEGTLEPDAAAEISIPLKYTGSGGNTKIPVRFIYSYPDGGSGETMTYVYVNAIATGTPGPVPDTSKFKPLLQVSLIGEDNVFAGYTNEIKIRIHNLNTIFSARNVVLKSMLPSGSPLSNISFFGYGIIGEIKQGEYIDVTMNVTVDKFAEDGTVVIPLKLSYSNIWNDEFVSEADILVKVIDPADPVRIIISDITTSPGTVDAGSEFDLDIELVNSGTYYAENVKLVFYDLSTDGFMMVSGSNTIAAGSISGNGTYTASIRLRASEDMKNGSFPLGVRLEYEDERKNETSQTQQIWIPVKGRDETYSSVSFASLSVSAAKIDPSDSFTVKAVIKNEGNEAAKLVKIQAASGSTSVYATTQDTFFIQTLQPGESKTLSFGFEALEDAPKGLVPVILSMDVPDGKGGTMTISQSVSVFQNGKPTADDPGKDIPRIIINSYVTDPNVVKAGEDFLLDVGFENTHSEKTIYNIKVSFNVSESSSETGNVFSPIDSSNTIYIDSIEPKGIMTKQLHLYTITDAKAKTYTVTFSFDYQDAAGNPFKSDEIIGIPVYQPSRFEISEPYLPPEVIAGQPLYLYFEMYNLGKNTLYNVKLRVEGVDAEPKSAYYGNFEPGYNEYAELSIIPAAAGSVTAVIIVSYEDASGEINQTTREVYLNVIDMPIDGGDMEPWPPDGLPDNNDTEQTAGFFGSLTFKLLAAVLAAGIIVSVVIIVKKKRREGKGFEI